MFCEKCKADKRGCSYYEGLEGFVCPACAEVMDAEFDIKRKEGFDG